MGTTAKTIIITFTHTFHFGQIHITITPIGVKNMSKRIVIIVGVLLWGCKDWGWGTLVGCIGGGLVLNGDVGTGADEVAGGWVAPKGAVLGFGSI